jgi:hypothetical protein
VSRALALTRFPGHRRFTAKSLRLLEAMRASDIKTYGAKAANLGEIVHAKLPGMNVPRGFGIPIYCYAQHMRQSGLDKEVASMLANPRWKTEAAYRKRACDGLRAKIGPRGLFIGDQVWIVQSRLYRSRDGSGAGHSSRRR